MAGLVSTGIYGFICSILPTGKRDSKGKPLMEEHFLSGFAGWGWKIWKTVTGFFRLEIDELVVRRTMTVFELLIQKIRAVKGAMAITQANGKIKSIELSADETFYLLTLEEEDMSFVEYDFIRCQEFTASQRFYHVEVASVLGGVIRIPVSEFEGSSIPLIGDEIVQFGNSSHEAAYAGRHSAIYMHADESGQPAIDVMFNIYSKDWTGCVKTRVGGDIPGSGGLKGFYCENGMIKGVDSTGHTVYCIYPDGSAMFGDGSAKFNTDKSGHIAGGAIAWEWNAEKKKYVCTMKDVVLTWDNLSDEAKENLKGETGAPGKDANLLPWIEKWNGYATELGEEYIVTPKMFSGTKSADGKLTGIAQGKECITIDGVKRTGIFALVDNKIVFSVDSEDSNVFIDGEMLSKSIKTGGILINSNSGKNVFSLTFTENEGDIEPKLVIRSTKYSEYFPYISISGDELSSSFYFSEDNGANYDLKWIISKDGIKFSKDVDGFQFSVDSEKTIYNGSSSPYAVNISRLNPGFLPSYDKAIDGEIYATDDGTLKVKNYVPKF